MHDLLPCPARRPAARVCGSGGTARVLGVVFSLLLPWPASSQAGVGMTEILGRPTATSVTLSVLFDQQLQVVCQFGPSPGTYTRATAVHTSVTGTPVVVVLDSLQPDQRYYYRTTYRRPGDAVFTPGGEHTFHTQRKPGSTFRFTLEADPHPYDKKGSHTLWKIAVQNQLRDSADFLLDLGDTFGDDHTPLTTTSEELRQLHLDCRAFLGAVCHSSPLFLCLGNHEGESGYYLLQTPPDNIAVQGTLWRKFYYPNPVPDGFYSGNTAAEGFGVGLPENYYAWEWGDALFVVVDAYRYYTTSAKPRGWEWTIGKDQYDWLRRTLESSRARFKFVITHHTLGETRGGAATAGLYEWGGYEADGRTWGFAQNRPGWAMPIHQLMVANGVTIFFQGHDHLFAREQLDGLVYQEVPMPSDSTYVIGIRDNGDSYGGVKLGGSGHVRVTVAPDSARVDYVQAWLPADEDSARRNGAVAYSYAVRPGATAAGPEAHLPDRMSLAQNYPNPFNPTTTIRYQIPSRAFVTIRVCDILGREVAVLVNEHREPGTHLVAWSASGVPSGVYFYRLQVNGTAQTRTAVVLK